MSAATDVYTDLDVIADQLLAADPPELDDTEPLPLVGPTADEAQDKLDAALIAASTGVHGSAVKIGSVHASAMEMQPTVGRWIGLAECAEAPPADQDELTEARSQAEAAQVIAAYCEGCPVAERCLDEGRATRGWGVYGGLVLVDGRKAAQHRPGEAKARRARPAAPNAVKAANAFLAAYLTDNGPSQRAEILATASGAGHNASRISAAATRLGVTSHKSGQTVEWSLPEVERLTEQATQGAALWLIDHLAAHGATPRQDVLTTAPYSRAATLAGAALLDLDPESERWELL